jgi:hypothetical protein
MGNLARLLSIFAATALLAFGVSACGDDDPSPTTARPETEAPQPDRAQDKSSGDAASDDKAEDEAESRDGGRAEDGGAGGSDFVPKKHNDSGGGSEQFRVKGGDNSVQEFGEEADASERDQAATALHNFLDARAAEAWGSACSFLSRDVRESLEKLATEARQAENASCAGIMAKLTNRAALPALRKEAARADVGSLRVEGDRAFVLYRGTGDTILTVPMANEDGSWKVASLAGTPLN